MDIYRRAGTGNPWTCPTFERPLPRPRACPHLSPIDFVRHDCQPSAVPRESLAAAPVRPASPGPLPAVARTPAPGAPVARSISVWSPNSYRFPRGWRPLTYLFPVFPVAFYIYPERPKRTVLICVRARRTGNTGNTYE